MAGEITFGRTLRTLRLPSVVVTETLHAPALDLPKHEHANANINFVLRSTFAERVEHHTFDCHPGSLLMKPDGAAHSNRYGHQHAHCLVVEFLPKFGAELRQESQLLDDIWYSEEPTLAALGWQLYRELRQVDSTTALAVEAVVLELAGRASDEKQQERRKWSAPNWLRRIRQRLEYCTSEIQLAELTTEAAVHPRHVMRAFRRYTGYSIGEYIRRQRVRRAQRLLAETESSIAEVALETGFYDQSHFTRTFKRITRFTPSEYRWLTQRSNLSHRRLNT